MRALDIALAAFALRAAPARPEKPQRKRAAAVDQPNAAALDRGAIAHERAALVASLWPAPARQCVVAPLYLELPAPAMLGAMFRLNWPMPWADARALQARLGGAFPAQHEPELALRRDAA